MTDPPTQCILEWDTLKPAQIYTGCSNRGIDMAYRRTHLRHNLHEHCQEMLKNPDRYFHPIWYNLREDRNVNRHMRKVIEEQLLNDILDAVCFPYANTSSLITYYRLHYMMSTLVQCLFFSHTTDIYLLGLQTPLRMFYPFPISHRVFCNTGPI